MEKQLKGIFLYILSVKSLFGLMIKDGVVPSIRWPRRKLEKGSKIVFIGEDGNGIKGGMVSEIIEHKPANFVSIRHYGFLDGDTEVTSGEQVEKWAGGHENYSFVENGGITTVIVEMDAVDEYLDFFNKTYPLALDKLKEISEK